MVKKRGIVWNYYTKKVDGSQVIVFCKFCDQSYIQNATRMERHMERCPKCPEDVRQQFIQAAHSKKHKVSILDWPKQESSVDRGIAEAELEDLDDWSYRGQSYSDEAPSAIQQSVNLAVENSGTDGNPVNRNWGASGDAAEPATAGSQERASSARQRKSHTPRRIAQWPFLSVRGAGYISPLQSKIFQEQLLERRALRKAAELELRRKTLELERLQWQYERDKAQGEVRWAHETRMMQLREERERQLCRIEQSRT